MREAILDFIATLDLGTFKLSSEHPWTESGTPLYIKNLKTLYVESAQYETDTILTALNGLNIQNQIVTVTLSFACDAKQLPSNYGSLISQLKNVNDIEDIELTWQRKFKQEVEYDGDIMITNVDYIFTKILT